MVWVKIPDIAARKEVTKCPDVSLKYSLLLPKKMLNSKRWSPVGLKQCPCAWQSCCQLSNHPPTPSSLFKKVRCHQATLLDLYCRRVQNEGLQMWHSQWNCTASLAFPSLTVILSSGVGKSNVKGHFYIHSSRNVGLEQRYRLFATVIEGYKMEAGKCKAL